MTAAGGQTRLLAACAGELARRGQGEGDPVRAFCVPGRIEVLGKHTDYCGGRSLLAATEQGFVFAASPAADSRVVVIDALRSETVSFRIAPDLEPERGSWSNYPMIVARRLARNFPTARRGARVALASSLPAASGMSSSSALMIGIFEVLAAFNDLASTEAYRAHIHDAESLAAYLATVENGADFGELAGDTGVGTQGGSEDHTAIMSSKAGALSLYSFRPVRFEGTVPFPPEMVFAVASSGIAAEKTGAAMERYNRASRLARAVVHVWNQSTGAAEAHMAGILRNGPRAAPSLRDVLAKERHPEFSSEELLARFEHFRVESEEIVPEAARCLQRGDLEGFGRAVNRSQALGARLLANQVPETVFLAQAARDLGAAASSAFGAGFGGSVWALVGRAQAELFLEKWRSAYENGFPAAAPKAKFFTSGPSAATFEITAGS